MDADELWEILFEGMKELHLFPDNADVRTDVLNCLTTLSNWLYTGGFPPDVMKHFYETKAALEKGDG